MLTPASMGQGGILTGVPGLCLQATAQQPDRSYNKKPHPFPERHAFQRQMKKNGQFSHGSHGMDYALAAMEQMELYCEAHPGSPAAVRRPRLVVRGELWIALLGPTLEEGIVGIGPTVTAALRAFDAQYLAGLRLPTETIGKLSNSAERTFCSGEFD